ncbi:MBL fold metallo-hydrolase [Selenomonas caprae]|uniref:MBL fold metallo-hydrolase n=1 Tax=Selenomonas caprae TaxID=2606905 RepID=A0A5D6WPZ4_9FIRM|nr:ComEC/Rec2 family competence protein [Selenomonas caprae]MBQ1890673.1 MBL fold metallo-hydrolase [Selenomonas sp.]TYZ29977.1 MBL fold metallo-hydrolase [Selenomonas caprae]
MRKKIGIILGLVMLTAAVLAGCGAAPGGSSAASSTAAAVESSQAAKLTIKMLNVGQGDAILVQTAEQTVLVDTSDVDERDKLKRELDKAGVKRIDKVILTHPHADHIGGMALLLKEYEVGEVYDNGMPSTSKIYIGYMKELKAKGIKRHALKDGDVLDLGNGVSFKALYPSAELAKEGATPGYKHDPNNESVVGKLTCGAFSMLLTGDAEKDAEEKLLAAHSADLRSTILKSGHHGSATASSVHFLKAVWPETVLISCGQGNDYGHPHPDILARYLAEPKFTDRRDGKTKKTKIVKNDKGEVFKAKVYETDKNGTITVTTDGNSYEVTAEQGAAQ